jgi:hypothetical protein
MSGDQIFVLRHEHQIDGYDSTIILGVYSTFQLAETAQEGFAKEPGFRDHIEGFIIHECKIDDDLWSGGFVTVRC